MGILKDIGFYLKNRQTLQPLVEEQDFLNNYEAYTKEAARVMQKRLGINISRPVDIVLTLGSGLNELIENELGYTEMIDYKDIPHFPTPTTEGHTGRAVYGKCQGLGVLVLQGRKHYYEVADQVSGLSQISFPIDVIANLGTKIYFATNAAGGLEPHFNVGDLMTITSHLSNIPDPRLGRHKDFGENPRFTPMDNAYNKDLERCLFRAAADINHERSHSGVYAAFTGPHYETNAEIMEARKNGVSAVGMSTAPEIIVARNRHVHCVAFSSITNKVGHSNATNHEEVVEAANNQETKQFYADTILNFLKDVKPLV